MLNLRQAKILEFGNTEVGIKLAPLPTAYPVWTCTCGSPLFYIAQIGPVCARCLEPQEIPNPRG